MPNRKLLSAQLSKTLVTCWGGLFTTNLIRSDKENNNHAARSGLTNRPFKDFAGINIKNGKRYYFDNIQEAAEFVKGDRANIHKCLNKRYNRVAAYGYTWEYI